VIAAQGVEHRLRLAHTGEPSGRARTDLAVLAALK
jgi:hypothetical protein